MDCREYRRIVSRELDGPVDETERASLERHMESCPACRRFREVALAASSMHRRIVEVAPPADLASSIVARAARRRERAWLRGWLRFAIPAAAAAAVIGVWLGGALTQHLAPSTGSSRTDVLELEYLDEYPPGSMGDLLAVSDGGGNNERE